MGQPLEILGISSVKFPQAQCKNLGEFMIPASPADIPYAKSICATCVHIAQCLEVALEYAKHGPAVQGVWGGTDESERAAMMKMRSGEFAPQSNYKKRERAIELISLGYSIEEISMKLGIQVKSIQRQIARVKEIAS